MLTFIILAYSLTALTGAIIFYRLDQKQKRRAREERQRAREDAAARAKAGD